ncbi:MAG: NAD(P)H-dependent oxidoreductase subunit E, partial [Pirellulales bacterium]|nr:NAD(P)H-dependent oxidoreductase subunit E [Pirellulales bacterium]
MIAPRKILTAEMIAAIEALAPRYPDRRALTLPALHIVNDSLRYVPLEAVVEVAELLGLKPAEVQDSL